MRIDSALFVINGDLTTLGIKGKYDGYQLNKYDDQEVE